MYLLMGPYAYRGVSNALLILPTGRILPLLMSISRVSTNGPPLLMGLLYLQRRLLCLREGPSTHTEGSPISIEEHSIPTKGPPVSTRWASYTYRGASFADRRAASIYTGASYTS